MKHFASLIVLAATAAFMFPLTFAPVQSAKCSDPTFVFTTWGADTHTVVDTSGAKEHFCSTVDLNRKLWKL